jgi:hypothetical protein
MTAVEWLIKEIEKHDKEFSYFYNAEIEKALEMEKQQMFKGSELETFEISDEEIEKMAQEYVLYNDAKRSWVIEGAKWYREQLKQRK